MAALAASVSVAVVDVLQPAVPGTVPEEAWTRLSSAVAGVTAITFLFWLHRVRANLPALAVADARWSPGWAVGWWFVPGFNLFRPYQVIAEIWQASDPVATPGDWRGRPVSPLLGWWWALFLARIPVAFAVPALVWAEATEAGISALGGLSALFTVGSAGLAIRIVGEIGRRQEARAQRLSLPAG
jgi:hypothetical protein